MKLFLRLHIPTEFDMHFSIVLGGKRMEKLKLYVISHTHWDREWYQTFQRYRYRLVRVMDNLIEGLEKDEDYKVFHLDGQTIVLEDYLEIRPENRERLTKLIQDGRIVIGPWFVMPDEFLISGESLVKNLKMGHAICEDYGAKPMKNGYVTDIFGHNSQFPQILNGFDIHAATLYRGIGNYEKDAFRWKSPDGSEVIAAKLEQDRCYSNFYFAVRWPYEESGFDPEDAVKRMRMLADRARGFAATDRVIMMDGVDHCGMEPMLPEMLRLFEKELPDVEFIHVNLEEYFKGLETDGLDVIEGSLYHTGKRGLNNSVLKNVLSSMVHVKQANDRCETQLTNISEPLNAFCEMNRGILKSYKRDDYSLAPRRTYLDRAWKYLITNHPHDSICGCSLSDVHRDNIYRYRQAQQMAEVSEQDCMEVITRNIGCTGDHQEAILLYNPTQQAVKGVRVFKLQVKQYGEVNRRFYDSQNREMTVQVLEEKEQTVVKERLLQLVHFEPYTDLTVAAYVEIPAFGYTVIYCDNYQNVFGENKPYTWEAFYPPCRLTGSQMRAHNRIDNGVMTVELNPAGLLDVTLHSNGRCFKNLHLLENRSDGGEGWNWRPVPYDSTVWGNNALKQFEVVADGPLCTVWKLTYKLRLPEGLGANAKERSKREHDQYVTTVLTVVKDSEILYFKTKIKNETENNRMRVLFPTNSDADCFYTKTPFDFVKWPVKAEDTHDYNEPDTLVHPAQGITAVYDEKGAAALYTKGLYEVEVTDNEEKALAVTLFRAAGIETGTLYPEDIQMQREMEFEYALSFASNGKTETMLEGEAYRSGIHSYAFEQNSSADVLDGQMSFLEIEAKEKIVSAVYEKDGKFFVRLYDVSGNGEKVSLRFPGKVSGAAYVNLKDEILNPAVYEGNTATADCPPHKIVTVCVELN